MDHVEAGAGADQAECKVQNLPRNSLLQKEGQTPRAKARMANVEKTYRKVTGKMLGDVIKVAKMDPVAGGE